MRLGHMAFSRSSCILVGGKIFLRWETKDRNHSAACQLAFTVISLHAKKMVEAMRFLPPA